MEHKQPEPGFPALQPLHFIQAELIDAEDEPDASRSDGATISTTQSADESISSPTLVRSEALAVVSKRLERFEFVVAQISRQLRATDADDQWKIQHQRSSAYRYVEMLGTAHEQAFSLSTSPASIFQWLNAISPQRFNDLLSILATPPEALPLPTTPHRTRVLALLDWVQGSDGPGMTGLQATLQTVIAHAPEPNHPDIGIEMVSIPDGSFTMGSPPDQPPNFKHERPQHWVKIPSFFMGRYPVTRAQWRIVSTLVPVKQQMMLIGLESGPLAFGGDDHPVTPVNWQQAVEFCDRLSRYTGRTYRLPTEAEWEYACRAGTETPFHFGETISPALANYRGTSTFDGGPEGVNRQTTTPVDHFGIANAFGLSDMHGNVFEWCLDQVQLFKGYEGAPVDGSAWLVQGEPLPQGHDPGLSNPREARCIFRGGSWQSAPKFCRSAYRYGHNYRRGDYPRDIGFRVVCCTPFL